MSESMLKFMKTFTWDSVLLKLVIAFGIYTLFYKVSSEMATQTLASISGAGLGAWAAYQFTLNQQESSSYEAYGVDIRKLTPQIAKHLLQILEQKKQLIASGYYKSCEGLAAFLQDNSKPKPNLVGNEFPYLLLLKPFNHDLFSPKLYQKTSSFENLDFYNANLIQSLELAKELKNIYHRTTDNGSHGLLSQISPTEFEAGYTASLSKSDAHMIVIRSANLLENIETMLTILYYDILLKDIMTIPPVDLKRMKIKNIEINLPLADIALIRKPVSQAKVE